MKTKPYTSLPAVDTSLLRSRPDASVINNPISLVEPVLPAPPNTAKEFADAQIPEGLEPGLAAFNESLRVAGEIALATGMNASGVSGLYGRSSKLQQNATAVATSYMNTLGETYGRLNDAGRTADLVNEKFHTSKYTVDVKKFVAQVDGSVDKYEANADAYVQAMNIIYDADVTAAKLKSLGVEKAIGFEAGFELDVRKNESQAFIALDRSAQSIMSREVDKQGQIYMSETRQLNTHGYTSYEHERNNDGRSYEMTKTSKAELDSVVTLSSARIAAAKSAAEERKTGAEKVTKTRNDALTLTTGERIAQLYLKTPVLAETARAENAASITALQDKITANTSANSAQNAAELAKDAQIMSARVTDKETEFEGTKEAMRAKEAAQSKSIGESAKSRESLNQERIDSVTAGYKKTNDARKDVSDKEYDALGEAIKIGEKGMVDVVEKRMEKLDLVMEQKFKYAKEGNEKVYEKEAEVTEKETNARIKALETTSTAERSAATDRAKASSEALKARHEASAKAAEDMKRASIDMTDARIRAAEDTLKDKYNADEESNRITFDTKESVEKMINGARLAAAEAQSAFDLENLRALNDARLAAQDKYIDAEIKVREREISAQLSAQGITLDAQSYESRSRMASAAYVASRNMKMHSLVSLNQSVTEANNRVLGIANSHNISMYDAVTKYWIASGSQETRRDIVQYKEGK